MCEIANAVNLIILQIEGLTNLSIFQMRLDKILQRLVGQNKKSIDRIPCEGVAHLFLLRSFK